jgi:hypothetical protein
MAIEIEHEFSCSLIESQRKQGVDLNLEKREYASISFAMDKDCEFI